MFIVVAIAVLFAPLVLAAALTAIIAIGPVELTIIYVLSISCGALVWRSFRRRDVDSTP